LMGGERGVRFRLIAYPSTQHGCVSEVVVVGAVCLLPAPQPISHPRKQFLNEVHPIEQKEN